VSIGAALGRLLHGEPPMRVRRSLEDRIISTGELEATRRLQEETAELVGHVWTYRRWRGPHHPYGSTILEAELAAADRRRYELVRRAHDLPSPLLELFQPLQEDTMKRVRARFMMQQKTSDHWSPNAVTVRLGAQYEQQKQSHPDDAEEIHSFAQATPSGHMEMLVDNPDIPEDFFELGASYYITLEKIPPQGEAPAEG